MKCKLTGNEGTPIDAHIIPYSFFEIDTEERLPTRIITNTQGQYPKRAPKGIYDRTIVTEEGERIFSPWDKYAAEVLLHKRGELQKIFINGRIAGFTLPKYNYQLLKLFALSVIWRASVSTHHFFRNVKIGVHEKPIRKMLLNNDPGPPNLYSVIFAMWSDRNRNPGMMDPFKARFDNISYYLIYLSNYIMYVKIDKQSSKGSFRSTQLLEDKPLVIIARELNQSKELPILVNMAKLHAK